MAGFSVGSDMGYCGAVGEGGTRRWPSRWRAPSACEVDLLVEFERGHAPRLMGLAAIEVELSQLLRGQLVDWHAAGDLGRHFRDEVVAGAAFQYTVS